MDSTVLCTQYCVLKIDTETASSLYFLAVLKIGTSFKRKLSQDFDFYLKSKFDKWGSIGISFKVCNPRCSVAQLVAGHLAVRQARV
jgi:hypothetical protein